MSTTNTEQQKKPKTPPAQETVEGRRLVPVGLAMGTAVVALAVSVLLNADGMVKNASIQPDSPARDVALSVTHRIAGISGALGLTQPRKAVEAAVGNSGKDKVVTGIGSTAQPTRPQVPATAPLPSFSRAHKMQLYVGGDSLSLETAAALADAAPRTGVIRMAEPDGHLSTGLLRPDAFNWFDRAKEVEATIRPDVSVLVFGGNDNDGYMTGGPSGDFYANFGTPTWERQYRRRVALMMDTLTQRPGQLLIWVGAPVAQDPQLNDQMKVLNRIYRSEAAKRKGSVLYYDTDPLFAPSGGFQTSINWKGSQTVVREPDGQHINAEGGVVLGEILLKLLERRYRLATPTQAIVTGGAGGGT
jgi:hypothetical protein